MRIEQTALALAAFHERTRTQVSKTSMTAWVDAPTRPFVPAPTVGVAVPGPAATVDRSPGAAVGSVDEGDPAVTDPKLAALIAIVERLLGHRVHRLTIADLHRIERAAGLGAPGSTPATAALQAAPPSATPQAASAPARQAPVGWGVDIRSETTSTDHERMTFAAAGSVTTADGRTIAIDLSLVMDRSNVSVSRTRVLAGDAAERMQDPLVLDLGGGPARLVEGTATFDLDGDGVAESMPLLADGAAYLARDVNGNGTIDTGMELFGPASGSGFAELAALDSDGNGWIDEGDAAFGSLLLWRPDGSGPGTLATAASAGVGAISVVAAATPFTQVAADGSTLGATRETGIWLAEDGTARTVQHVDVAA